MAGAIGLDPRIEARARVWLVMDDKAVFGDGRAQLLDAIRKTGSIKGGAAALGMSYRHAWGHVNHIEQRLRIKVIERHAGGRRGGGSRLTPEAEKLLATYDKFRATVEKDIAKAWRTASKERRRVGKK